MHKDVRLAVPLQGPSSCSHGRTAVLLPRLRQKFHRQLQPEVAHASPLGREAVCLRHMSEAVHSYVPPQSSSSDAHWRTAVWMPSLRPEFQSELQPEVTYSNPHRREAVCLRHMSDAVRQDRTPQVARAKASQQRAALQVRRLPKELHRHQQTAQSLEDVQLRALQHRRADTYRFERLRCRR